MYTQYDTVDLKIKFLSTALYTYYVLVISELINV
jgi:hypothetical protein